MIYPTVNFTASVQRAKTRTIYQNYYIQHITHSVCTTYIVHSNQDVLKACSLNGTWRNIPYNDENQRTLYSLLFYILCLLAKQTIFPKMPRARNCPSLVLIVLKWNCELDTTALNAAGWLKLVTSLSQTYIKVFFKDGRYSIIFNLKLYLLKFLVYNWNIRHYTYKTRQMPP